MPPRKEIIDGQYQCARCKEWKPVAAFPRDKSRRLGIYPYCNLCNTTNANQWYRDNPGQAKVTRKQYYEENRDYLMGKGKEWVAANPDKVQKAKRKWFDANPEKRRENVERWRRENPDAVRAIGVRAQAKRRALLESLPSEPYTVEQIVERDGTDCGITGKPLLVEDRSAFDIDHLVPLKVKAEVFESCQPYASHHPGDVFAAVRLADPSANSSRKNRYTLLDHCQLQHMMPELFPEVDWSKYDELDETGVPAG